jgi:hypothetical protein
VKTNVDASFVPATGCVGMGVVARDSAGRIKLTAVEAEALACVEGISPVVPGSDYPGIGLCENSASVLEQELEQIRDQLHYSRGQGTITTLGGVEDSQGKEGL